MHCCLFTQNHSLLSSGCAGLRLLEALTLSWATVSDRVVEKRALSMQLPFQYTVQSQQTISQISPVVIKKKRVGGGKTRYACIKFNTFVTMATIQHVIHLSSCIRAYGIHCLRPGEHGSLETRPPFSSFWSTSRSFTKLLFVFNSSSVFRSLITW